VTEYPVAAQFAASRVQLKGGKGGSAPTVLADVAVVSALQSSDSVDLMEGGLPSVVRSPAYGAQQHLSTDAIGGTAVQVCSVAYAQCVYIVLLRKMYNKT
jgi:hypothetical protein